ncbi:MAG: hypothetical protein ABFQ95_05685 [Pseudomonadota bacterium]
MDQQQLAASLENDLQRYMQLRQELKEDIKEHLDELQIHTIELAQTSKRFIAHFDIFKTLSDQSAAQIGNNIEHSAQTMANTAVEGFSGLVDTKVNNAIDRLNESVWHATNELQQVSRDKIRRNLTIAGLMCLVCLSVGFSAGYFFTPR